MIAIIDLEISNITSVFNAFQKIGVEAKITNDMAEIETAGALILPGVGAFEQGINFLNNSGLAEIICERVLEKKIPILGICLGMQLLANSSTENGNHIGLGLLEGRVERLKPSNSLYRVPNIGWSPTEPKKIGSLFEDLGSIESYYYVHSYHYECKREEDVSATIEYSGMPITVSVERDNICGVQFHPEKSQDSGLNLLNRYVKKLGIVGAVS